MIDAARFIKKALNEIKGFDEDSFKTASAEDWDLDKRIKNLGEIIPLEEIKTEKRLGSRPLYFGKKKFRK